MSSKMDKNDNLYKIVNIDGVDYRIEIDENPITHKKRYKVDISRNNSTKEKESRKQKCKADLQK